MRTILGAVAMTLALAVMTLVAAETLETRLEATLATFLDRHDLPGLTTAIALPDSTVISAAAGLADVEAEHTMTRRTRMLAASFAKTFMGATVLALESKWRLSLVDRLADYLGGRPWVADLPYADTITLGHLLRHTAGLPDHVPLPAFRAAAHAALARVAIEVSE